MKDAKSLLLEVLAAIPDGEKIAPLFVEHGVVELPFLHCLNCNPRHRAPYPLRNSLACSRKVSACCDCAAWLASWYMMS